MKNEGDKLLSGIIKNYIRIRVFLKKKIQKTSQTEP